MLQRAVETRECVYCANLAVLYFPDDDMPVDLAYVRARRPIGDIERDLLSLFAANVAVSVGNIEKVRIQDALSTARKIQESMLPEIVSEVSADYGVDLCAHLIPAKK